MLDGYFSKRYNLKPRSGGIIEEYVPASAREDFYKLLDEYFQDSSLHEKQLYFNIVHAMHLSLEDTLGQSGSLPRDIRRAIRNLVMNCEWWQFYDICEVVPRSLNPSFNGGIRSEYLERLNGIFSNEKLGFEITDQGLIERVDTSLTDKTIKKARYLMEDPRFEEAGEHFEKALRAVYHPPAGDGGNGIRDAVAAVEGVARGISGNRRSTFYDLFEVMAESGVLPDKVADFIRSTAAMADIPEEPGSDAALGPEEGELVLAVAAAIIDYLNEKGERIKSSGYGRYQARSGILQAI